jgi:hypothetical protein
LDVIASEAWQSLREKIYYYGKEDILFMRLPRFARNDTFILSIINKSVTLLLNIKTYPLFSFFRRIYESGFFALVFFEKVIDFPADVVGDATDAGGRGCRQLILGDFFLYYFFDFFPDFIEHNVVNHYSLF